MHVCAASLRVFGLHMATLRGGCCVLSLPFISATVHPLSHAPTSNSHPIHPATHPPLPTLPTSTHYPPYPGCTCTSCGTKPRAGRRTTSSC